MQVKTVTIIGLGLIGGSLGMALKKRCPEIRVKGVDINQEIVFLAEKMGAIDEGTTDMKQGVLDTGLVFLAAPVSAMPGIAREIGPFLAKGVTVTDMGSTKEDIVRTLEGLLPSGTFFLGGHPMAGSEKEGIIGASEHLMENAAYILTPTSITKPEAIQVVRAILEKIGARIIILSPHEHDRKVAAVSHLPHVIAGTLINTVGALEEKEGGYFPLAAGGFRDTTRIAASQSKMWVDILLKNDKALLPLIKSFKEMLGEVEAALEEEDEERLFQFLSGARRRREKVPTGLKGIIPQLFEFTVMVPDEPGVLAGITGALKKRGLNISDIEIQRVREENEGTIRLGFLNKEVCDEAASFLEDNGYTVRKSRL
jgi:prephenate dehydrogenase